MDHPPVPITTVLSAPMRYGLAFGGAFTAFLGAQLYGGILAGLLIGVVQGFKKVLKQGGGSLHFDQKSIEMELTPPVGLSAAAVSTYALVLGGMMLGLLLIHIAGPAFKTSHHRTHSGLNVFPLHAIKVWRDQLGLMAPKVHLVLLGCVGIVAMGPISDVTVYAMKQIIPMKTEGSSLDLISSIATFGPFPFVWLCLALGPGLGEELVFRGFFQRLLGKGALPIILSGFFFALAHMDPHHVAGVLPLGFYLAWLANRTQNIWASIAAHTTNNTVALLAARTITELPTGDHKPDWMLVLGGVVLGGMVVGVITWLTREKNQTH